MHTRTCLATCLECLKLLFLFSAVAVNAKLQYAVVEVQSASVDVSSSSDSTKKQLGNVLNEHEKPFLIIALDLVPTLEAKWHMKLVVKKTLLGSDLEYFRLV